MKTLRNVVILLVVLGLLVGAYVFVKNKKAAEDEANNKTTESTESKTIIDISGDTAEQVIVQSKNFKVIVDKKDGIWTLTEPNDIKVDKNSVSYLVSNACLVDYELLIEENASDLAQYGLATPNITVTVKETGGKETVLEIGNQTITADGYYAKLKGSSKVYKISNYLASKFETAEISLRDKNLFLGEVAGDITALSLERSGQLVFSSKRIGEAQWELTKPLEISASYVDDIAEVMPSMQIANFIEKSASDLEKYGLKNPSYAVGYETKNGDKVKIYIGKRTNDAAEYFAKLESSQEIFTISKSSLDFLDKPLLEVVDRFAFITNITGVNKLVAEFDGKKFDCDIKTDESDQSKDKFTVNGKDASMKNKDGVQPFRKFYESSIGITFDEIEIADVKMGKPEITLSYFLKDASKNTKVEFVSKNDKYYYVFKNGKYANVLVDKKIFDAPDGFREWAKKLQDAIDGKE